MRFSNYFTETNLNNPQLFTNNHFYSDNNLDRSEPYTRLLDLIQKIVEEPYLFQNITQDHFRAYQGEILEGNFQNCDQSDLENIQSQMEIENIMETIPPKPELKHKCSIQNRMPIEQINPEVQPCPLSMSLVPSQKYCVVDDTIRNIDEETVLTIEHLRSLFSLQDTNFMVMVLGYLIKLVTLGLGFHFQMNNILKKFAGSYLIATKMSYQSLGKGVAVKLSQVLGLDNDTILSLQKQFLVSMNFHLEISKQYLDQIARLLFI